jgi:hypothetical protein
MLKFLKKVHVVFLPFIATFFFSQVAIAEPDGKWLQNYCKDVADNTSQLSEAQMMNNLYCIAYVKGVYDGFLNVMHTLSKNPSKDILIEKRFTANSDGKNAVIVEDYLTHHQDELKDSAPAIVILALGNAFDKP